MGTPKVAKSLARLFCYIPLLPGLHIARLFCYIPLLPGLHIATPFLYTPLLPGLHIATPFHYTATVARSLTRLLSCYMPLLSGLYKLHFSYTTTVARPVAILFFLQHITAARSKNTVATLFHFYHCCQIFGQTFSLLPYLPDLLHGKNFPLQPLFSAEASTHFWFLFALPLFGLFRKAIYASRSSPIFSILRKWALWLFCCRAGCVLYKNRCPAIRLKYLFFLTQV